MLASRVGVIGALIGVLVISAELAGAIAYKHHVVARNDTMIRQALADVELDARTALEQAITARKGLGDALQNARQQDLVRARDRRVPNRAGY